MTSIRERVLREKSDIEVRLKQLEVFGDPPVRIELTRSLRDQLDLLERILNRSSDIGTVSIPEPVIPWEIVVASPRIQAHANFGPCKLWIWETDDRGWQLRVKKSELVDVICDAATEQAARDQVVAILKELGVYA